MPPGSEHETQDSLSSAVSPRLVIREKDPFRVDVRKLRRWSVVLVVGRWAPEKYGFCHVGAHSNRL